MVIATLGSSSPSTETRMPGAPLSFRPIRIVTATRLMPGATWHRDQKRVNSASDTHCRCSTITRRIRASVALPPPNDWQPSKNHTRRRSHNDGRGGEVSVEVSIFPIPFTYDKGNQFSALVRFWRLGDAWLPGPIAPGVENPGPSRAWKIPG